VYLYFDKLNIHTNVNTYGLLLQRLSESLDLGAYIEVSKHDKIAGLVELTLNTSWICSILKKIVQV